MAERYRIFFNALENYPTNLKFRAVDRELARSVAWRHFCSVCAILRVLFRLGIRACDSLWWYGMMWLLSCALWIFRYAAMRVSFEETGRISSTFFHFVEFALARCPQIWKIGGNYLGNFIGEVVWYQSKTSWYGWWWTVLKNVYFQCFICILALFVYILRLFIYTLNLLTYILDLFNCVFIFVCFHHWYVYLLSTIYLRTFFSYYIVHKGLFYICRLSKTIIKSAYIVDVILFSIFKSRNASNLYLHCSI